MHPLFRGRAGQIFRAGRSLIYCLLSFVRAVDDHIRGFVVKLGVTGVMLPTLDFDAQLGLCSALGIRYYQYRPRVIPDDKRSEPYSCWGNHKFDLTPERWVREGAQLTARLRDAGIEPWGAAPVCLVDMDDDTLKLLVEGAVVSEAGAIRCMPPSYPQQAFDYADYLDRTLSRYRQVVDTICGPAKVKLLIETHAGSSASGPGLAYNILSHFESSEVGAIFDLPNFAKEGFVAPALAVSVLAPWIDCLHVGGARRVDQQTTALGRRTVHQFCAMEESDLYLPDWFAQLADHGIDVPMIIEDYDHALPGDQALRRTVDYLKRMFASMSD